MAKWMIDPGHGDHDPGAVGHGLVEKDMNLQVALKVAEILKEHGEAVHMTRTNDVFITLTDRCAMANRLGVDYFVSIHHNAGNSSARGMEVIYSLKTPAIFPQRVLDHTTQETGQVKRSIYTRKTKEGNDWYAVLRGTRMQAIITEFGFVTNHADAELMNTKDKLMKEAVGIAKGCLANVGKVYKGGNAPGGSIGVPQGMVASSAPTQNTTGDPVVKRLTDLIRSRVNKNQYTQEAGKRTQAGNGFSDCSGLVQWAYKNACGIDVGSYTAPQAQNGRLVSEINVFPHDISILKPGDLIFYRGNNSVARQRPYQIGHVEMYLGNNELIGHGYGIGPIIKPFTTYRPNEFVMARRYLPEEAFAPAKPKKVSKYFSDIPGDHWSIDLFDRAFELNLLSGRGNGQVGFSREKAETVAMLLRLYDLLKA